MPIPMFDYRIPEPTVDRFAQYKPGYVPPPTTYGASGASSPTPTTGGFVLNPAPTSGQGPHGAVPGQLGLPNPAGDLAGQVPGLSGLNSQASANILSKLKGELSKNTLDALKNTAAAYGVSSGMPGSGLSDNAFLGNIAGAREALQTQGVNEYNATIPTVSGTQTVSPALQNEIATQNSLNAAAPDPTQAASYAMQLFQMYLNQMGRGGSSGGGFNPVGGGGGIAAQVNAAVNPVLSRYNADLDRKLAAAYSTPSSYVSPQSIPQVPGSGKFSAPPWSYDDPMSFDMIAPNFNYQTSPWNPIYGTKQDIPADFYWE